MADYDELGDMLPDDFMKPTKAFVTIILGAVIIGLGLISLIIFL